MDDFEIGKAIKTAREQAGLTQSEIGEVIHLSRRSVGDRENGRTGFRASEIVQLRTVLKVRLFD
jgi:transcriptional regulator with XRE-family HTH domain